MEGMKKTDKALCQAKHIGKSKVAVLKEAILAGHNEPQHRRDKASTGGKKSLQGLQNV